MPGWGAQGWPGCVLWHSQGGKTPVLWFYFVFLSPHPAGIVTRRVAVVALLCWPHPLEITGLETALDVPEMFLQGWEGSQRKGIHPWSVQARLL